MEPELVNARLILDDINKSCMTFSGPTRDTIVYHVPSATSKQSLQNKEITHQTNQVCATMLRSGTTSINDNIVLTGNPTAGQVLTAVGSNLATWATPGSTTSTSKIVYVDINAAAGGDGSADKPYNQVADVHDSTVGYNYTIYVMPGRYMTPVLLLPGYSIIGVGQGNVYIDDISIDSSNVDGGNFTLTNIEAGWVNLDFWGLNSACVASCTNCVFSDYRSSANTTYVSALKLLNCRATYVQANIMDSEITNCYISTFTRGGRGNCKLYNNVIDTATITMATGWELNSYFTKIAKGTLWSDGTSKIDSYAKFATVNGSVPPFYVDNIGYNNVGTNIAIGNRIKFASAGGALQNADAIIIGSNNTIDTAVDDVVLLGSNTNADTNAVLHIGDNLTNIKMTNLSSMASGLNLVYDSTTKLIGYASSSAREKSSIYDHDISSSSKVINGLTVRDFRWKKTGKQDYGFIAEEVSTIDKSLTEFDENGNARGLIYNRFIPHLVSTCQVLTSRLDEVTKKLEEVTNRLNEVMKK